jgi:hypothetical protein
VPVSDTHLLEWSPRERRGKLAMLLTGVAFSLGAGFACIVVRPLSSLRALELAACARECVRECLCERVCVRERV